jgi:hypothetical protein
MRGCLVRQLGISFVAACVSLFGLRSASATQTDRGEDLAETVQAQGLVIQQLWEELGRMRGEQRE